MRRCRPDFGIYVWTHEPRGRQPACGGYHSALSPTARMMYHPLIRTLFEISLLAAISGCSSTPTGIPAVAGRYELRSVDGRAVPIEALGGALGRSHPTRRGRPRHAGR